MSASRSTAPGGSWRASAARRSPSQSPLLGVGPGGTQALSLARSRPNPAFGSAAIAFTLPRAGHARLAVYDLAGARVRTLVDGETPAGNGAVVWDGRDSHGDPVRSGAYFYRLEFDGRTVTRRLVLMR